MKKLTILLATLALGIGITSCDRKPSSSEEPVPTYTLSISDFSLEKGSEHTIRYTLSPTVSDPQIVYEVLNMTPENTLQITDGTVYAYEEGVANIKARAFNKPGASTTFSAETEFKITVLPVADPYGDEIIKNGGFENGYDKWELTTVDPEYIYKITINSAKSHTGDASLNLWYNPDEKAEDSVELDLKISQSGLEVAAGTYLFSFWFIGEIADITASVYVNEEAEASFSDTFPGYGYKPLVTHNGYVNYGLEVTLAETSTIKVELHFTGDEGCWGYVDDISFELGTIEDVIVPPKDGEDGEHNFITNGSFDYNVSGWEINKPEGVSFERVSDSGGRLSAWNVKEGDVLSAYYLVKDLPELDYNAVVYFIGGAGAFASTKLVILSADKVVLHSEEFVTTGWGTGVSEKAVIMDVPLSGDVYVGVEVVGSAEADWINFDNFALWSFGYEPEVEENGNDEFILNVSLAEADWIHDGEGALTLDNLWFSSGISYGSSKVEGPLDELTLTQTIDELDAGSYTINVTYEAKHANLSVNGVTTEYDAGNWDAYVGEQLTIEDVVVAGDGLLLLEAVLTPGTYGYAKLVEIVITKGEVVEEPVVEDINVSLAEADWTHDGVGDDTLDNLWFSSGISYGSTKLEGPHAVLTLSQTLNELAEGTYDITLTYDLKHGNININGVTTEYDGGDWNEYKGETLVVSDVAVAGDGLLPIEIIMTPGTYSYVKVVAITVTKTA